MRKEAKLFLKILSYTFLILSLVRIISSVIRGENFVHNFYEFLKGWVSSDFYILWILIFVIYLLTRLIIFVSDKKYSKKIPGILYISTFFILIFTACYSMIFILPFAWLIIIFDYLQKIYSWQNFPYDLVSIYIEYFAPYVESIIALLITYFYLIKLLSIENDGHFLEKIKLFHISTISIRHHPNFSSYLLNNIKKFQTIILITMFLLLIKVTVLIVEGFNFITYETKEYSSGINLPELNITNGVEFADEWSDLFLTIDRNGRSKLNNIDCTQEELISLFRNLNAAFSKGNSYTILEFKNQHLWHSINSNLVLIVDRNCEMFYITHVINNAYKFGLRNLVFLVK